MTKNEAARAAEIAYLRDSIASCERMRAEYVTRLQAICPHDDVEEAMVLVGVVRLPGYRCGCCELDEIEDEGGPLRARWEADHDIGDGAGNKENGGRC